MFFVEFVDGGDDGFGAGAEDGRSALDVEEIEMAGGGEGGGPAFAGAVVPEFGAGVEIEGESDARFIDDTAGADLQKDRIEVEIVAWGRGKENWSVDYRVLMGDIAEGAVWRDLDELLDAEISGLPIRVLCIDSGYNPQIVYDWARRHPQASWGPAGARASHARTVVAVKGTSRSDRLIVNASVADAASKRRAVRVWTIGTPVAKSQLYSWLRLAKPTEESGETYPAGFAHFPCYEEEYFRQLTAESLVKGTWVKDPNRRNEALDCRVYARAAAAIYGIDRFRERQWKELEAQRPKVVEDLEGESPTHPAMRPVRRMIVRSPFMAR